MNNFKKATLMLTLALSLCTGNVLAQDVKITLNGNEIKSDVAPFIKENRTLVPVRFISDALEYDVKWDNDKRTVSINNNDKNMVLTINDKNINVDGKTKITDVAPTLYNNRTYVPIRFISENFGVDVKWDNDSRTVVLENEKYSNLTSEENEYLNNISKYTKITQAKFEEIKSYFYENASKYSKDEIKAKFDELSSEINLNVKNISELNVPDKFKKSHKLLLEAMDNAQNMLNGYEDALIEGNSDMAKKVMNLQTKFSIKISEAAKALQSELKGEEYTPDKDIEIYNETVEKQDKNSDLLNDETIKNLLEKI